MGKPK